ncbi:hypothetical protein SUGI_0212010 [Cryptomeria japonica]|nr:hypothetical protein SUGI_0212010 [Cryptomeria japonica]
MDFDMDDWRMILATFALIICMLWDVVLEVAKDYLQVKIRPWIPTNLFVLSALTIQILGYVQIQKVNVFGPSNEKALELLVRKQLGMDAARLTMCVFVGCLLPEMAMAGTQGKWSNVATLFLSFSFHIATEIYALENASDATVEKEAGPWFMSSGALLLVGATSLLLLLGAVILSGKLERDWVRWYPHQILPGDDVENEQDAWDSFRRRVMESWIRSRAWKTWYFVSSSKYSPGVGMIVTVCVAVMAAKVAFRSSLLRHKNGGGNLTFFLQCVFILLGWILMLYRWFKAALYCSVSIEKMNFIKASIYQGRYFAVPIAVMVNLISPRLAYFLLFPRFSSQFVQHLWKLDKKSFSSNDEYLKYQSILHGMGFAEADLQHIFWKTGSKSASQSIENSWMETIAAIFSDIADVKVGVDMENAFAAYRETVNVLKFVDYPENIVFDPINTFGTLNFYAFAYNIIREGEVREVERRLKKGLGTEKRPTVEREVTTEERARLESVLTPEERERVDKMLRDFRHKLKPFDERVSNILLMRLEECSYYNVEELGELLRTLVGHVIISGLLEAPDVILKCTKQWAQNADEKKIERAIELAGMVTALLENVVEDGDILFSMV